MLTLSGKTKGQWQGTLCTIDSPFDDIEIELKLKRIWLGKFTGICKALNQTGTIQGFFANGFVEINIDLPQARLTADGHSCSMKDLLNEQGHNFNNELPLKLFLKGQFSDSHSIKGQWYSAGLVSAGCCGFNKIPLTEGSWQIKKAHSYKK